MNSARLARKWTNADDDPRAMAEALDDELKADLTELKADLATKGDLAAAVAELRTEIERMAAAFARAQTTQTRWFAVALFGHYLAVLGSAVALIRFLA